MVHFHSLNILMKKWERCSKNNIAWLYVGSLRAMYELAAKYNRSQQYQTKLPNITQISKYSIYPEWIWATCVAHVYCLIAWQSFCYVVVAVLLAETQRWVCFHIISLPPSLNISTLHLALNLTCADIVIKCSLTREKRRHWFEIEINMFEILLLIILPLSLHHFPT